MGFNKFRRRGGQQQFKLIILFILQLSIILLLQTTNNQYLTVDASLLQSLASNAWSTGNLQKSYSDANLNRNFTFRRNFPAEAPTGNTDRRRLLSWSSLDSNLDKGRRLKPKDGHCSTNYKFDYVQLTLQWAPGACSTSPHECKRIQNKHFTIHGMWPTQRGTREPANCCFDNTFDFNALKPILADLDEYWYSYFDSSSRGFWSHEWLKHGTCSRDIPQLVGEAKYFGTTLKLAKSLPILQELAKASIVPNTKDKPYPAEVIIKTLQNSISNGKIIGIDCDYEHDQPIPVLTGLNFCFDSNMQPADCPETRNKCKKQILFRL